MSFPFGGGASGILGSGGSGASSANAMMMAQAEFEMDLMTQVFNSMLTSCHKKCISSKYLDGELNKGEAVCIDRCVAKYTATSLSVGQKMQSLSPQQQVQA